MGSESPFCADCVKGVLHEGTAQGKWEEVGGVRSYVATPLEGEYAKDTAIVFCTDVFGAQLINAQLVADSFAQNGYKVVVPDYFNGDPLPTDAFNPGANVDINSWFAKHSTADALATVEKVLAALKEEGVTKIGVTGYCYGARPIFDLAFENKINVVVVNHPTFMKAPDDFEKYLEKSKAPLLINSCTFDDMFPIEAQATADKVLGDGKFAPGYKREYFEGCHHGFAIRGDLSDPKVKAGKEGAFNAAVTWFKSHL